MTQARAESNDRQQMAALSADESGCMTLDANSRFRLPSAGSADLLIDDVTLVTRAKVRFNDGCPISTGKIQFTSRRLCRGDSVQVNGETCAITALDHR